MPISRPALALLLSLPLAACGGSTATQSEPAAPLATSPAPAAASVVTPAEDPWATVDPEALRQFVRERAVERLRDAQPDFDISKLDAYLEEPESAPELSGRAVERLFDLALVDLADGKLDHAASMVRFIRARAKNRNSAYAGATYLAEIARRQAGEDVEAQKTAIAVVFRELPRPRFGSATIVFQLFQTPQQIGAEVEQTKTQMLSLETASTVVFFSDVMPQIVASRDTFLAAIDEVRKEHERQRGPREYRFSTVDLTNDRKAQPVRVAVWDAGTNTELFGAQLYTNEHEEKNGRDDDGNGLVDDLHGIVSDPDATQTGLLYQPAPAVIERFAPFLKGIMDLRAGLSSTPDAQRVLELMRSVTDAAALVELERNLDAVGEWAHGTHVAGILLAGNPHAKLAIFRSAWAGETRTYFHRGPTDQELAEERRNGDAIAAWIKANEIRVVNASLGFASDYLEDQLRHERDRYRTDEDVRARAEQVHAHRRETWRRVFEAAPDTLFVISAGNSNRDVVEYADTPPDIDLPNVVPVGAVDRYGSWATFTNSSPTRVRIFDFGVEVPSLIPSGNIVPLSGTSMASPNVANLAAKMLAVAPTLTPKQIADIIEETGDPIAEPFNGRIANERKAIARARQLARTAPARAQPAASSTEG